MADARSAPQPSSPPRPATCGQSRRLSKRAFKRTAQPAGPSPCWRPPLGGGLGGAKHSKDARGRFEGGIGHSRTGQTIATPHEKQIPQKPNCSSPVVSPRTPQPARAVWCLTSSSPAGHRCGALRTSSAPWTAASRTTVRLNGQQLPGPAAQPKSKT